MWESPVCCLVALGSHWLCIWVIANRQEKESSRRCPQGNARSRSHSYTSFKGKLPECFTVVYVYVALMLTFHYSSSFFFEYCSPWCEEIMMTCNKKILINLRKYKHFLLGWIAILIVNENRSTSQSRTKVLSYNLIRTKAYCPSKFSGPQNPPNRQFWDCSLPRVEKWVEPLTK